MRLNTNKYPKNGALSAVFLRFCYIHLSHPIFHHTQLVITISKNLIYETLLWVQVTKFLVVYLVA